MAAHLLWQDRSVVRRVAKVPSRYKQGGDTLDVCATNIWKKTKKTSWPNLKKENSNDNSKPQVLGKKQRQTLGLIKLIFNHMHYCFVGVSYEKYHTMVQTEPHLWLHSCPIIFTLLEVRLQIELENAFPAVNACESCKLRKCVAELSWECRKSWIL